MFTLITVTAVPGYFSRAGECHEGRIYEEATAADVLRIAREYASCYLYKAVGIRVGNRRKSPVLWVKLGPALRDFIKSLGGNHLRYMLTYHGKTFIMVSSNEGRNKP